MAQTVDAYHHPADLSRGQSSAAPGGRDAEIRLGYRNFHSAAKGRAGIVGERSESAVLVDVEERVAVAVNSQRAVGRDAADLHYAVKQVRAFGVVAGRLV